MNIPDDEFTSWWIYYDELTDKELTTDMKGDLCWVTVFQ